MQELQQVLTKITALQQVPEPYVLKQLIALLRDTQHDLKSQRAANDKIRTLIDLLKANPEYADGLTTFVLTLLNTHYRMSLFTDTGISDYGLVSNFFRLVGHRFIPLLPDDDNIIEMVDYLLDNRHDQQWLAKIDIKLLQELVGLLSSSRKPRELVATAKNNVLNAMVILSYRINGLGLHQDLMTAYPEMLDYAAAFVAQNQETVLFANQYRSKYNLGEYHDTTAELQVSTGPLLVMLEQCDNIVSTIRKRIYKTGITIRLTNMLLRLEQSIRRLRHLSELLSNENNNRDKAIIELTHAIIVNTKRRYSIGHLISTNTELLSRKVTENSGRVGEHYISTDKAGYQKMFKMAAIGGLVISFMATTKILSYDLELAPMGRAFVNSMIYGLGFVFIHIIHGTVATKQPAMTAAAIASTISTSSGKKSHQLAKLSELMVDIIRTQFIAIVGNVMVAMPLAFIISFIWLLVKGAPMIGYDQAEHLIADLNPITSLALLHAAIAGVYLFISGLIAGFYDNFAVFNHIGERISRHKLLLKVMPVRLAERFGRFVEANLGAIMGNFIFGVFLGSTATVGFIFGLPLDIRHIAFASANFAHGFFNLPADQLSLGLVLISVLGVALIGCINLFVSFSLALIVALRAKGVAFNEWKTLAKLVFNHLVTHTRDFFWPRPAPMQYTYIDSSGQMIYKEGDKKSAPYPPSNSQLKHKLAVRRLSDIKVMPNGVGIDSEKIAKAKEKRALIEKLRDPTVTEVNPTPVRQVVLSDNSALAEDTDIAAQDASSANNSINFAAPTTQRIEAYPVNEEAETNEEAATSLTNPKKESLPKPKKPPNLPH